MKTPRVDEFFAQGLGDWDPTLNRREFLKLSSAALALAGLPACIKPPLEKIFSYVSQPEDLIPGNPEFFATHFIMGGMANGLLVETHEGRPTRIDGNPLHPANLGSSSAIQQALVLSLYDPDRIRHISFQGAETSMSDFQKALAEKVLHFQKNQGEGLAILSEVSGSELVFSQKTKLLKKFPKLKWVEYEPLVTGASEMASFEVFGETLAPVYDFKKAALVVSIDSDFLNHPHSPIRYAKDFADNETTTLFAIESSPSLTGAKSRHRLALKPSRLIIFYKMIAAELLGTKEVLSEMDPSENKYFKLLLTQIKKSKGSVLFVTGDHQSVEVHALSHLLNEKLGANAITWARKKPHPEWFGIGGIERLTTEMNSGRINTLLMVGGNPVYTTPAPVDFKNALKKVPFSVHLSLDQNETNSESTWLLPKAHILETWSDGRAYDGVLSFSQPMVAPMYSGISESEFLELLLSGTLSPGKEILTRYYRQKWGASFETRFQTALTTGIHTEASPTTLRPHAKIPNFPKSKASTLSAPESFEISFREDRKLYDGRFSNHPWLQEFPDALTRLSWGNAVLFHPSDLETKKWKAGQIIEITVADRKIRAPVFAEPLQAKGAATLSFGGGRAQSGSVASGIGFNSFSVWAGNHFEGGISFSLTDKTELFASTQGHHSMEGRNLVRTVAPGQKASLISDLSSLYPKNPIPEATEAWAMTIDLDRCTGCGSCVIACQSENNIPVVGVEGVRLGREMHWIRVDRYFENSETEVTHFQPVPCMHCEKAPCEPVCPTGATLHGNGGLNQMVYNRCVGTRYCSNNCPYKVRRFNFLTYNDKNSKLDAKSKNPNVSVRTRGVMEKCTYCVQRINSARIKSRREGNPLVDGDVKTACQVSCPSQAIQFGNLMDPESTVSRLKNSTRNYGLLEELGTLPRTSYLAKIKRVSP